MSMLDLSQYLAKRIGLTRLGQPAEGWGSYQSISDGGIIIPFLPGVTQVVRGDRRFIANVAGLRSEAILAGDLSSRGLQFLQPLSMHYALGKDASVLEFIENSIADWHAKNPPFVGLSWSDVPDISLRVISILFSTTLCGNDLSESTRVFVLQAIRAHAAWLYTYVRREPRTTVNRAFADSALYLIGSSCGSFAPDYRHRIIAEAKKGISISARALLTVDGTLSKDVLATDAVIVELLLLCTVSAAARGSQLSTSVDALLMAYAEQAPHHILKEGGIVGHESDGQRVLTFGSFDGNRSASLEQAISRYLNKSTDLFSLETDLIGLL